MCYYNIDGDYSMSILLGVITLQQRTLVIRKDYIRLSLRSLAGYAFSRRHKIQFCEIILRYSLSKTFYLR